MKKIPHAFYNRDTVTVAKDLLGKYLVHKVKNKDLIGKIVEVEAYVGPHDLAAHTSKGVTKRTAVMFGPPGYAYVYLIYGIYCCINVVTEAEGHGSAVLIRAIEPIKNITARTQGPGLLCKALDIDRRHYGHDLTSDDLFLAYPSIVDEFVICKKPRIGVAYAKHWAKRHLRFYIKGNAYVSRV